MYLNAHIRHASGRCKNVCTSAVLDFFGIDVDRYHYAQDSDDVRSVLRRHGHYSVRSRASMFNVKRGVTSIGQLRTALRRKDGDRKNRYYVSVVGHAMVLDGAGTTLVDTAPRKRDRRRVRQISLVTR